MNSTETLETADDFPEPYEELENFVTGIILLALGAVGCYFNTRNCIAMFHLKEYSSSYGYLCTFRSICNVANLLPVIIFTAPQTLFDLFGSSSEYSRILGLLSGIFYLAIPMVQMAVAFNRCVALFYPMKYNRWCTKKWAKVVIAVGIIVGTLSAAYDLIEQCRYVYERENLSWAYEDCPRENLDIVFNYPLIVMTVISIVINTFTVVRIMTKKVLVVTYEETDKSKLKKNLKLFWQGLLQEIFFANDMLFNTYLGELINNRIWWFISYTLMWSIGHTLDGVIFFCFNKDLQKRVNFRNTTSTVTIARATSTLF